MRRIGHSPWTLALAALLAAGCGGSSTQGDAGAGQHDSAPDAPIDAGPRVRDACTYTGQEGVPQDPHYPYSWMCPNEMSDPDCISVGLLEHGWDGDIGYIYDCKTPP